MAVTTIHSREFTCDVCGVKRMMVVNEDPAVSTVKPMQTVVLQTLPGANPLLVVGDGSMWNAVDLAKDERTSDVCDACQKAINEAIVGVIAPRQALMATRGEEDQHGHTQHGPRV